MTEEKVFLTDARREVLTGDYGASDSSRRAHQTRIRKKSRLALQELIEVAESPHIQNADVFEPKHVARLIATILSPPGKQITPRWNFDGTDSEYREAYGYETSVCWRLEHLIDGYADTLLREEPPGESVSEDPDLLESPD